MSTDADNSIDFFDSTSDSTTPACFNSMNSNDEDLLGDLNIEPMARNPCNTWPTRYPAEFQTNDSSLMHEKILEENAYVIYVNSIN
jgi:hypothetical protein